MGIQPYTSSSRKHFFDLPTTVQEIKDVMVSPFSQTLIGAGLGIAAHRAYMPLTERIVKFLCPSAVSLNPFSSLSLSDKIFLTPFICILGPALEEIMFRGSLQEILQEKFESFFIGQDFSDSAALTAARVASVFFTAIIFGLVHFTNAIFFWCNPILFLPQVVAATIMGLMFGLAKELTGELHMPIAMHVGNNTLAWDHYIFS